MKKKILSVLITTMFGVIMAAVVAVIGGLVTLACMSLVVSFCAIFDLSPDYRLIAAIIGSPIIAALTVLSIVKYVRALLPQKKVKEPAAQTEPLPSAPTQGQAPLSQ